MSQMMSCLDVNDVFDELIEENKRLNRELIFANRLLKVLLEMKYNLMNKLEDNDCEYTLFYRGDITKFIQLEEQFNIICKENGVVVNEEVFESVQQNSVQKVNEQTSTEILDLNEDVEQRRTNQLIEHIDQVINQMTEEIGDNIEQQEDQLQIKSNDNQIGEQQDCQMEDQNNGQEDEHSSIEKGEPATSFAGHQVDIKNLQYHIAKKLSENYVMGDNRDDQLDQLDKQIVIWQIDRESTSINRST